MPFSLSEDQLAKTEQALGVKLPEEYRAAMKLDNGGETSTDDDDWTFYSIKDTSDKKRLIRTCQHVISETESCKGFGNFPEGALAIAGNGLGDQMVFIKEAGRFLNAVFLWFHETGELKKLTSTFAELEKR